MQVTALPSWVAACYDHGCSRCALSKGVSHVCLRGRGSEQASVLIVGEAPGYHEDRQGAPFVGPSGQLLDELLSQVGLSQSQVYITNVVKCRPPDNREPTDTEIIACVDYLWNEIQNLRPKVIVTLGKPATRVLTGLQAKMGEIRGRPKVVSFGTDLVDAEGKALVFNIPVIPSWHPAYILRGNERARADLANDLALALRVATEGLPKETARNYREIGSHEELVAWADDLVSRYAAGALIYGAIGVDLETNTPYGEKPTPWDPRYTIISIQVSSGPGEAVFIPVILEGSAFASALGIRVLCDQLKKVFDRVPVAGQNFKGDYLWLYCKLGLRVEKLVFDVLLAHHCLWGGSQPNDLDYLITRYLGQASHKSLITNALDAMRAPGKQLDFSCAPRDLLVRYGCDDAETTLRLYPILRELLRAEDYSSYGRAGKQHYRNLYEAFLGLYMQPWRCVVDMEIAGAPLDYKELPLLEASLYKEMSEQLAIVHSSRFHAPWQERTKKENKKRRKQRKKSAGYYLCNSCGWYSEPRFERAAVECCLACHGSDLRAKRKMLPTGEMDIDLEQPEWIYQDLNPASPQQVALLLWTIMRLPGGGTTDREAKEEALEYCALQGLEEHAAVLRALLSYAKASKLYTAYAKSLPNYIKVRTLEDETSNYPTREFEPRTGLWYMHTNYYQDGTVTGRLSTREPPLHTVPRKSVIKRIFISRSPDGFVVCGDYSQLEVRLFVVESGDRDLRDVFIRGEDPHRSAAAKTYGVALGDVTEEQRQLAKATIFGLLYGSEASSIADRTGLTEAAAAKIKDDFLNSAPLIKKWIADQHKFARKYKVCISKVGRIRFLQEDLDSGVQRKIAHALRCAVNTPIQGLGSDITLGSVSRVAYRFRREGLSSVVFGSVHDSGLYDVQGLELLSALKILREEMQDKLPVIYPWLNVPLAVDFTMGLNWCDQMKVHLEGDFLMLSGKLSLLTPIVHRLGLTWKVFPEKIIRSRGKDGIDEVTASLKLAPR